MFATLDQLDETSDILSAKKILDVIQFVTIH